jgi:hypothetical protein
VDQSAYRDQQFTAGETGTVLDITRHRNHHEKTGISMGRHCTHTQHNRGEALEVARELRISLAKHGITIPALVSTEGRTLNTQLQPLIQLGSVTVDTAEALLDALRRP